MAKRREIETERFQAKDASGRLYTIVRISEQKDVGGLDGTEWMETMARLVTTEGHSVNSDGSDTFHIVNLRTDVTRVGP